MRNPTVKQVAFVIDKLKLVRKQANEEGAFDIKEWHVYDKKHKCGTVHCVGGWYAVANLDRRAIKDKFNEGRIVFNHGTNLMAQDLGFRNGDILTNWAYENPKIWGNENGHLMFDIVNAYDNAGFDGVIAQWELVKQNLIELEK